MQKSKGKNKGRSSKGAPPILKVVYLESGFECSCPAVGDNLPASIDAAGAHGIQEVSKALKLPKRGMSARPLGPLIHGDGLPYSVDEWASQFFVAVEAKEGSGLLARSEKQKDLIQQIVKDGVEDVGLSPPPPALATENTLLKESNASLKANILLLEQRCNNLQLQILTDPLSEEVKLPISLKSENESLVEDNKLLKLEDLSLRQREATLELKLATLEIENKDLRSDMDAMKEAMDAMKDAMSTFNKVVIHKLLEQCRRKARDLAKSAHLHLPNDWNQVCADPTCVAFFSEHGLNVGLPATRFGAPTAQEHCNHAAHEIFEDLDIYASIVCKMEMSNIFEFLFERKDEEVV